VIEVGREEGWTRQCDPADISVITNISPDHQVFLGRTLKEIAREKVGLSKEDQPDNRRNPTPCSRSSGRRAKTRGTLLESGTNIRYRATGDKINYYGFKGGSKNLNWACRSYQHRNAALALGVMELLERRGVHVSKDHIREGLKSAYWPGGCRWSPGIRS